MTCRSIFTKFLGPTDTKGARVRASSDGRIPSPVTVGFHSGDNRNWSSGTRYAAEQFAIKASWSGVWVMGSGPNADQSVFVHVGRAARGLVRALENSGAEFFVVKEGT